MVNQLGRSVPAALIYLIEASAPDRYEFTRTNSDGSYKFDEVPVGEYYLAVNPKNEPPGEHDPPYGRAYYPNAKDTGGATKIVVAEGAKLENLTLRVGRAWKGRTVSGKVIWHDGTTPKNAYLSLRHNDQPVCTVKVDDKGMFSFQAYGDFKYFLEAYAWGVRRAKSDLVPIPDKSTDLTLVLKEQ